MVKALAILSCLLVLASAGLAGSHKVKSGDNDSKIAKKHGITVSQLRKANPGVNWRRLQIGQTLDIPGGRQTETRRSTSTRTSSNSNSLGRYARIDGNNVAVRATPESGRVLARLDEGSRGYVVGAQGSWVRVQFANGPTGWVRRDLLAASSAPAASSSRVARSTPKPTAVAKAPRSAGFSREDLIAYAKSFKGVRYRFGGSSRSGTDCSGFTLQVFRSKGITLPRSSAGQARIGTPVSRRSLAPGDLVFFSTRGMRVGHVGIYVGSNQFIHAPRPGTRVRVESMSSGYYSRRYVGARRVVRFATASKPAPKPVAKKAAEAPKVAAVPDPTPQTEPNPADGG